MPEYGHPYSSGLDDSPIFDGPLPTTAPDLGAYLVLQDLELARFAERFGRDRGCRERTVRAPSARSRCCSSCGTTIAGFFRARAAGEPRSRSDAVVSLMPLLTGRAARRRASTGSLAALDDPRRFGTAVVGADGRRRRPGLLARAHVARAGVDQHNTLVVEGLRASGQPERARDLAERTVALVVARRRPARVLQPDTRARRRETATTAFGWSAALFIDLAVGLSRSSVE